MLKGGRRINSVSGTRKRKSIDPRRLSKAMEEGKKPASSIWRKFLNSEPITFTLVYLLCVVAALGVFIVIMTMLYILSEIINP